MRANLPSLEVVLKDIERENPDRIFCLVNLLGYHSCLEEVLSQVRGLEAPTLIGNHEEGLQLNHVTGTNGEIIQTLASDETKDYLLGLPRELTTSYGLGGKRMNLWMVHGSQKAIDDYITEACLSQQSYC